MVGFTAAVGSSNGISILIVGVIFPIRIFGSSLKFKKSPLAFCFIVFCFLGFFFFFELLILYVSLELCIKVNGFKV